MNNDNSGTASYSKSNSQVTRNSAITDPSALYELIKTNCQPTQGGRSKKISPQVFSEIDNIRKNNRQISVGDKAKLDQFLTELQAIDQTFSSSGPGCTPPSKPSWSDKYTETKEMIRLAVFALVWDISRVLILQIENDGQHSEWESPWHHEKAHECDMPPTPIEKPTGGQDELRQKIQPMVIDIMLYEMLKGLNVSDPLDPGNTCLTNSLVTMLGEMGTAHTCMNSIILSGGKWGNSGAK